LSRQAVLTAAAQLVPDAGIRKYAVFIDGRAYPPKLVVATAAGLPTSEFVSTQARRLLAKLGFEVCQVGASSGSEAAAGGASSGEGGGLGKTQRPATERSAADHEKLTENEEESVEDESLSTSILGSLADLGARLGFEVENEVQTPLGRLDQVWWYRLDLCLVPLPTRLAAVAFEVEGGWRTRKHIKGDILNLATSRAGQGILVICGTDPKVMQLRQAAGRFVNALGLSERIMVWSENDVANAAGMPSRQDAPPSRS
jgi:hypothetical protein